MKFSRKGVRNMAPNAILYTSNTGFTRQYALILGKKTGLPVYSLEEAISKLQQGDRVIFLVWSHARYGKSSSRAAN